MKIELQHVHYMPKDLNLGVLYVSKEFGIAVHLCPCGCGSKIRTPLGPTEWTLEETRKGPTLYPSIGNWQIPCQSHYWITKGQIEWSYKWTSAQIAAGHRAEEQRRQSYYKALDGNRGGILQRLWNFIMSLLKR